MRFQSVIVFFILALSLNSNVFGARRKDKTKCAICPDVTSNYTAESAKAKFKELVVDIWYQDMDLTPLARRFRTLLLSLNANGTQEEYLHTTITSVLMNNWSPFFIFKPDACALAAVINGTVSCHLDNNQTLIQDGLTQLLNRFPDMNYDNMIRMIMSAGCDYQCYKIPPDAVLNKKDCYKNGFVYPIRELWNLNKPPFIYANKRLRNLTYQLYNSTDFVDNFIAVCTTYSLMDVTHRLWAKRNPGYIIKAIVLEFSRPIKAECCYSRITVSEAIRDFNDKGAIRSIATEKASIDVTQCNPPL